MPCQEKSRKKLKKVTLKLTLKVTLKEEFFGESVKEDSMNLTPSPLPSEEGAVMRDIMTDINEALYQQDFMKKREEEPEKKKLFKARVRDFVQGLKLWQEV